MPGALRKHVERAFHYQCMTKGPRPCAGCAAKADDAVRSLIEALPTINGVLQRDIQAAYEGYLAARSIMEVVLSYPYLQVWRRTGSRTSYIRRGCP